MPLDDVVILKIGLRSTNESVVSLRERLIKDYSLLRKARSFFKLKKTHTSEYNQYVMLVKLIHSNEIGNNVNKANDVKELKSKLVKCKFIKNLTILV